MTNHEILDRFIRIADILEIQGENPFKVRAYRNAADVIGDLEDSLEEINERGKLGELPGFGAGTVGMVKDFLTRGTTGVWEQVKDAVPPGVVQMARVPGMGSKTVKQLWDALKVNTVAELHQAAKDGKVRVLAGFGPAKESKLIENIEKFYRLNERTPRYVGLVTADRIAKELARRPEVSHVYIAGELRRGCESVTEVRLIAVTQDRLATIEAVNGLAGMTPEIPLEDSWTAVVRDDRDRKIVVRMESAPEKLGWTLLEETGPAAFYDSINPGVELPLIDAPDEDAVFAYLNLPYIAPELRDWPDIIEQAQSGTLPRLIEESDFKGQLHEHTTYSDGTATIRQMAEAAMARGYEYLAITDHSRSLTIANGLSRERLLAQLDEVDALNAEYAGRFTLLTGIEADILQDGSLDCDDDILERLDIVVGSVHIRYKEDEEGMTRRIVRAIENPHLDILGHPTGRLLGRREPYPVDMDAVISAAATHGKVLEINSSADRMDLNDIYARRAKEKGVRITINTDAHSINGLGLLSWGLCMARRAGLTPDDVVNTYSLQSLREAVGRRS